MVIPDSLDVVFTVDGGTRRLQQVDAFEYPEATVYLVDDGSYLYVHSKPAGSKTIEAPGRVLVAVQCRIEARTAFVVFTNPSSFTC